MVPSPVHMKYR